MDYINFETPATLTGDVSVEAIDKTGMRVWLGQSVGTISSGVYAGSSLIATGKGLGIYVRRRAGEDEEGKSVGTIYIDLGPIVAAAIDAFEGIEEEAQS